MKNNKTLFWVLGGVVAVGAVGFILWNNFRKKAEEKTKAIEDKTATNPALPDVGGLLGIGQSIGKALTEWRDYQVVTKGSNLNIRDGVGDDRPIVGKLNNGQIVKARAINEALYKGVMEWKGDKWYEVSLDGGKTIKGRVNAKYLKFVK